jgi:hypothetical protein
LLTLYVDHQGSASNPIDIDTIKTPSPHKFLERPSGYFAPISLQYRPSRPQLAPNLYTPNGAIIPKGKVGGHQSHDIYQMMAARKDSTALPSFVPARLSKGISAQLPGRFATALKVRGQSHHDPFHNGLNEGHYPRAYPTTASHHAPNSLMPYPTFYQTPVNGYHIFPKQDEALLRRRAVQYVLDHTRPRPRKRRLTDDPDATSCSEDDGEARATKRARNNSLTTAKTPDTSTPSTLSTGASEENMFDRNLRLTDVVEHTQLMASLLMVYPYTADPEGVREDIAMLRSVTEKRIDAWLSAENEHELETRQRGTYLVTTTPTPNLHKSPEQTLFTAGLASTKRNVLSTDGVGQQQCSVPGKGEKDDEIKQYLSAELSVWSKLGTQPSGSADVGSRTDSAVTHEEQQPAHVEPREQATEATTAGLPEPRAETSEPGNVQAPLQSDEVLTDSPSRRAQDPMQERPKDFRSHPPPKAYTSEPADQRTEQSQSADDQPLPQLQQAATAVYPQSLSRPPPSMLRYTRKVPCNGQE